MLWVDQYRPKKLNKLILHKDIGENLSKLVASGDCPHTLFYGPPGAGKKTLILAFLREVYGAGADKVKVETRPWKIQLPTRVLEVELTLVSSNHHVEMNPSDVGNNDRYVVQEILKDMAKSRPINMKGQKGFKMLVLNETDRLSAQAQHSLRRTMEKYSASCRLVLCCNNVSKVIEPVRSRCLCIRVAAPTNPEVEDMLSHVAQKEGLQLPDRLRQRIAQTSERNLRRALLCFETCHMTQYPFKDDQAVQTTDWELYVQEIANDILAEQTPKRLFAVRGKMYELLVNCIPPELILKKLMLELVRKLDDELKHKVADCAAFFEHRLQLSEFLCVNQSNCIQEGQKAIFHLEAFVARFMSDYKTWTIQAFG